MRKYLFLMIALVGVLGFTGCSKDDDGYYNPNRTFIYTAQPNDWSLNNDGSISYEITLPELTSYYITDGFVSVAMSDNGERSYDILPSTFQGVAYSVRYSEGVVTIFGEGLLAGADIGRPSDDLVFKVVLSDSDFVP